MDLSGRDFSKSDFEHANLTGANFSDTKLSQAKLNFVKAQGTNFENADLAGRSVGYAAPDFSGANFRNAKLDGTIQLNAKYIGANLTGASFANCYFNGDCDFTDAISDESTNFDGVSIMRAPARAPAFRYYVFDKGHLRRASTSLPEQSGESATTKIAQRRELGAQKQGVFTNDQLTASKGSALGGEAIKANLVEKPADIARISRVLAALADEGLVLVKSRPIPNHPDQIKIYEDEINLLQNLAVGLRDIAAALEVYQKSTSPKESEEKLNFATKCLLHLQVGVEDFLKKDSEQISRAGTSLMVGTLFAGVLSFFGGDPTHGFYVGASLIAGRKVMQSGADMGGQALDRAKKWMQGKPSPRPKSTNKPKRKRADPPLSDQ